MATTPAPSEEILPCGHLESYLGADSVANARLEWLAWFGDQSHNRVHDLANPVIGFTKKCIKKRVKKTIGVVFPYFLPLDAGILKF